MKKILATLLTLAMMLSLTVIATTSISAQSDAWDGVTYADSYSSGTGTADDPYIIMNGDELNKLSRDSITGSLTGVHFKLGDDINLGGNYWWSIGPDVFSGNFDGNGKTIFNFTVEASYAGLFGVIDGATIKNLKIDHASIFNNTAAYAGALAGKAKASHIENIVIGDNTVVGTTGASKLPYCGGVVGHFSGASVAKNIINNADVEVIFCNKTYGFVGGIFGVFGGESTLDGAINYGKVTYANEEPVTGDECNLGGIAGSLGGDSAAVTLKNVINYGDVSSVKYAGGIVGRSNADGSILENAFNAGNVTPGRDGNDNPMGALIVGCGSRSIAGKNCVSIEIDGLVDHIGSRRTDKTYGDEAEYTTAFSVDELNILPDVIKILDTVSGAMPEWATVTPDMYEAPVDTGDDEPVDTGDDEPVDTGDDEPVDSGNTPVDSGNAPETDPKTPETDPETEKPSGGCGSVVAGGLAILAVVALAGVALKKRD